MRSEITTVFLHSAGCNVLDKSPVWPGVAFAAVLVDPRFDQRIETRQIETTASLNALLAPRWFGVAQVCRITRKRIVRGKKTIETIFAITSLTAEQARPAQLLRHDPCLRLRALTYHHAGAAAPA